MTMTIFPEEVREMPSVNHSYLAYRVAKAIDLDDRFNLHIELSIDIDGKEYVPDVAVYERRPINFLHDQLRATQAPLMVAEIVSPTQSVDSVMSKIELFLEHGIRSCWLILPVIQTVTIIQNAHEPHSISHGDIVDDVLGIRVPISSIFD